MTATNAVIEKLRKILALANDGAAAQGEIEAAMGKAKEIAMRYNLDLSTISTEEENGKDKTLKASAAPGLKTSTLFAKRHHNWILNVLGEVFEVQAVLYSHYKSRTRVISSITLIGDEMDVAIAKEIFPWLEKMFPTSYRKAVKEGRVASSKAGENGFYLGLYRGICETNRRAVATLSSSDAGKYALVVRSKKQAVEDLMKAMFPNLKKPGRAQAKYDPDAEAEGRREGQKLNLKQMGGNPIANQLS